MDEQMREKFGFDIDGDINGVRIVTEVSGGVYPASYTEIALWDALAALSQPAAEWQPIETAPDGTMILCANMKATEARNWAFVAWLAGGRLLGPPMDMPTHWMPLPAAPKATT